jgi:uncharacterized repeat protein (TIGR04138 family)
MSSFAMSKSLKRITDIARRDGRYKVDAYLFVQQTLAYSQLQRSHRPRLSSRSDDGEPLQAKSHLSGQELCEDVRRYAQELYGLMAKVVLNSWGVRKTGDFGEIVYRLIEIGEMTKSDSDRRADFDDVYDFEIAFRNRYQFSPPDSDHADR